MRILSLLLVVASCAGCAVGGSGSATSDTPRRDLAGRPTVLATTGAGAPAAAHSATAPAAGGTGAGRSGSASSGARSSAAASGGPSGAAAPATDPSYRSVVTVDDREGDADLGAPAYADLLRIALADNGARLRVTVTVAGALATRLRDGESMGIGVDLYPQRSQRESDYQLFADGTADGWFAYLQTPEGFVHYPGTFALDGSQLVFTVPWSSVGSPHAGRVSAFVDWTQKSASLTGNPSSSDYAPIIGTTSWTR